MPPLPDPLWKLTRAHEHLDDLYAEIQIWRAAEPYRIIRERDPETGARILYAEATAPPPGKLTLIAGDAIHNLRSCLDMLALALAEANCGGKIPEKAEQESQFPICDKRGIFRKTRKTRIPYVAPRAQAIVQRLQPYRASEMRHAHPLWILRQLSDLDKHRRLPLVGFFGQVEAADVLAESWQVHELRLSFGGMLKEKKEVAHIRGLVSVPADEEVDIDVRLSTTVVFADGAPAAVIEEPLYEVLEWIWRYVAQEVVSALKPYLGLVPRVQIHPPAGVKLRSLRARDYRES